MGQTQAILLDNKRFELQNNQKTIQMRYSTKMKTSVKQANCKTLFFTLPPEATANWLSGIWN